MGRIRRAGGDDKENSGLKSGMFGASVRFSRPWDNSTKQKRDSGDSTGYASLRVEHFVDANIASRAAIFENGGVGDSASRRVVDLASRFESNPSVASHDSIRPGSVVRPWPDTFLRESNAISPKTHKVPGGLFAVKSSSDLTPVDHPSSPGSPDMPIKTQLGRRSVKPMLSNTKPPPVVWLPVPSKDKPMQPAEEICAAPLLPQKSEPMSPLPSIAITPPSKDSTAPMRTPTATTPTAGLQGVASPGSATSRGSARCSVRAPSRRASRQSVRYSPALARQSSRMSTRQSMRMSNTSHIPRNFPEVPQSSFLAFDENARLSYQSPQTGAPTSIVDSLTVPEGQREYLDFSDPDTFDTFGSLHSDDEGGDKLSLTELQTPEREIGRLPGLSHSESEKAEFPDMSYIGSNGKSSGEEEDDDDVLDVPRDMMSGSSGGKALRELQCASVTAGNELAEQVRQYAARSDAQKETKVEVEPAPSIDREIASDKISRAQGELELRSRFFRRWNTRYASIVDHAYFGAVLFLFRHDSKASRSGTIALKNSKMIVLAESTVRELDGFRKNGPPSLFELKTAQRKYVFACLDDAQRKYWLDNLTSYASS